MVTSIRVLVANRPPFARADPLVAPLPHLRPPICRAYLSGSTGFEEIFLASVLLRLASWVSRTSCLACSSHLTMRKWQDSL